jgi:hypothetical protein
MIDTVTDAFPEPYKLTLTEQPNKVSASQHADRLI